jgi:hypothetical protein
VGVRIPKQQRLVRGLFSVISYKQADDVDRRTRHIPGYRSEHSAKCSPDGAYAFERSWSWGHSLGAWMLVATTVSPQPGDHTPDSG